MQEAMTCHEELGLNPDEEALYDVLADRPEVLLSMGDAMLKKLASEDAPATVRGETPAATIDAAALCG